MSKRVDILSGQIDKKGQCSGHNCLLWHGIPENKNKETDDLCLATIKKHFELSVTEADIEWTHLIGNSKDDDQK